MTARKYMRPNNENAGITGFRVVKKQ